MSTSPETVNRRLQAHQTLLSSSAVVPLVAQPPRRVEPRAASATSRALAPSDRVDERLDRQLRQSWTDLEARARNVEPAPPVQAQPISLPAPPERPAPRRPCGGTPRRPEREAVGPAPERPRPAAPRPSPAPKARRPDEVRGEVARDRSQLEARAAEAELLARELSARESTVQEVRGLASSKRAEAAMLRSRVAERRAALSQFDLEMEDLVSQPGAYLDRFEEVERMQTLRCHLQLEIDQEEQASREADEQAARYARLAAEHERSLASDRLEVERRRAEVVSDRETIERRATDADRASGLMDHSVAPGALQFWSALARAGEVELAAFEARRAQEQLDQESRNGNMLWQP